MQCFVPGSVSVLVSSGHTCFLLLNAGSTFLFIHLHTPPGALLVYLIYRHLFKSWNI